MGVACGGQRIIQPTSAGRRRDCRCHSRRRYCLQITVFNTRTAEQKKGLFRRIAELLSESPGIRPQDAFINVLEAAKENWSLGHGLAQFA